MADIAVTAVFEAIEVRINGVLHLRVSRPILAVQSWMQNRRSKFIIQYTLVGGEVTSEYDHQEHWLAILAGLEKTL